MANKRKRSRGQAAYLRKRTQFCQGRADAKAERSFGYGMQSSGQYTHAYYMGWRVGGGEALPSYSNTGTIGRMVGSLLLGR